MEISSVWLASQPAGSFAKLACKEGHIEHFLSVIHSHQIILKIRTLRGWSYVIVCGVLATQSTVLLNNNKRPTTKNSYIDSSTGPARCFTYSHDASPMPKKLERKYLLNCFEFFPQC